MFNPPITPLPHLTPITLETFFFVETVLEYKKIAARHDVPIAGEQAKNGMFVTGGGFCSGCAGP